MKSEKFKEAYLAKTNKEQDNKHLWNLNGIEMQRHGQKPWALAERCAPLGEMNTK